MPKDNDYTPEELADLSEEERTAITGEDGEGETVDVVVDDVDKDIKDDENVDDLDDDADPDEVTDPDDADPDEVVDPEKADVPEKVIEEAAAAPVKEAPAAPVKLPDATTEAFKARLDELTTQFEQGDIELSEFLDGRDQVKQETRDAETQYAEQVKGAAVWKAEQDTFFANNDLYLKDEKRYDALNVCVKAIAGSGTYLSLADTLFRAKVMEEAMNGAAAANVTVAPAKEKAPHSPRPKVVNLGDLPATELNDASTTGEFAYMDKLSGLAYENALNAMSETKQDRYLKG